MDLSEGIAFEELARDVYFYHQQVEPNNIYNTMFLVTTDGVVLFDPHRQSGPWLQKAIGKVTNKPVSHIIYSHYHRDHIQDAATFKESATYVAHVHTARRLKQKQYPGIPLPDSVVTEDENILRIGDKEVRLLYFGPNHSEDNMVMYLPNEKVVLACDIVFPGWVPFQRLTFCTDVSGLMTCLDKILELDFQHFVPGHFMIGTRKDVQQTRDYVYAVHDATAEALGQLDFVTFIEESKTDNQLLLLTMFADRVTELALPQLRRDWGFLKGFDIVADTHVEHMFRHLCFGLY